MWNVILDLIWFWQISLKGILEEEENMNMELVSDVIMNVFLFY